MRFLKNRIAEAKAFQVQNQIQKNAFIIDLEDDHNNIKVEDEFTVSPQAKRISTRNKQRNISSKKKKQADSSYAPGTSRETKNLVKNYGKAICNFSTSTLAVPFLTGIVEKEGVPLEKFLEFAEKSKVKIDGLHHFREILLSQEDDNEQTAAFRRIYKKISEVFIKYFSVNWIYHSKVKYKKAHLNFRFKMLRRIKSPELFTYLKGPKNAKGKGTRKSS